MEPEPISKTLANMTICDNLITPEKPNPPICEGGCGQIVGDYEFIEYNKDSHKFIEKAKTETGFWSVRYSRGQVTDQSFCEECSRKRYEKERRGKLLERSGLSSRQRLMTFESFSPKNESQKKAVKSLIDYDTVSRPGIYIYGQVGSGKTHLLSALSQLLMAEHGITVCAVPAVKMLYRIRSTFSPESQEDTDYLVKGYSGVEVLFLDDLGAEKPSDWVKEIFYLIIDNRYNSMLPTFISSNYSPKELAAKLDDRLVSRLLQDSIITKLEGKDYRLGAIK